MNTAHSQKSHSPMSRREFLRLTGLAGGVVLAAACAAPPAPQAAGKASGEATAETTTIAWWNQFSTPTTQEVVPQIITEFESRNPSITVEYELSGGPPGGGDYIEVLLARIAAGNPPDTATLWSPPSQFAAQGSLTQIDDFMANAQWATHDAFFEGPLKSCQWQGKTYGLPASAGAGSIFINVAKFEEKGVSTSRDDFPDTWQGLQELSAQFVEWEGDELLQAGIVPWSESWLKPVWSGLNGGLLYDAENGRYAVDSDENVAWLTYWVQFLENQYRGDIEKLNLFGNWSSVYPESAFQLGISAMSISGSWACTDAGIPFGWEVVPFPVGPSGAKSITGFWPNWWAMPKGTPHPAEGFLFSEFFCTQGWEIWYRAIMDTPAWVDFPEGILTQKLVDEQGQERAQEIHNFYASYLENTAEMWNSPIENFASDTLDAAIDEVLHKQKTPAEALAEAQELVQTKLEEVLQSA